VKRSGGDESIWVVMHMCMEVMLGISLYSYLSQTSKKCYVFLFISYVFSSAKLEKKRVEQVLPGSEGVGEWEGAWGQEGEVAQCTHI
jgi:hypothetical protein